VSEALLQTIALTRRFGGLVAVERLSVSIGEGQTVALIGPNGAGKTTVFNVLSGIVPVSAGEVWFRGENITNLPPFTIARLGMARTFQITSLLQTLDVRKNVELAAHGSLRKRASPAASAPDWHEMAARTDAALALTGLAALAERPVRELSHGDQRRVEIAMAVAARPRMILLDEPTQGMSAADTWATVDLVKGLRAADPALTILIVEHDIPVVLELAERILVLHHGRLIADGSPDDIVRNDAVQVAYLGTAHAGR
jgi:branched-chain amino acid transport system ATP-binding protein